MKRLLALLAIAATLSTASAEFYFGLPGSTIVTGSGAVTLVGFQAGSHDVAPNLGVRGYIESDPLFAGILLQGGADVLFTTGGNSKFYVGGGGGFASIDTGTVGGVLPYLNPVIGGDFDAGTAVSIFIEASPRVYVGGGAELLFTIRSGVNFHIGTEAASEPQVITQRPVAVPVVDNYTGVSYPPGTYIDEEGNVWIPDGSLATDD